MYNRIGYLPEERGLHGKLTVEEELKYLATLKGMSKTEIQQQISYWLERFDITENRKNELIVYQKESTKNSAVSKYVT